MEVVSLEASVTIQELVLQIYDIPVEMFGMVTGTRSVSGPVIVAWHTGGLKVDIENEYRDLQIVVGNGFAKGSGTDEASGFLALLDDGTYRGLPRRFGQRIVHRRGRRRRLQRHVLGHAAAAGHRHAGHPRADGQPAFLPGFLAGALDGQLHDRDPIPWRRPGLPAGRSLPALQRHALDDPDRLPDRRAGDRHTALHHPQPVRAAGHVDLDDRGRAYRGGTVMRGGPMVESASACPSSRRREAWPCDSS